jgi:hypothetical protein
LVASEVAHQVKAWRKDIETEWGARSLELDVHALGEVLAKAEGLGLDPYLVAFVIMGAEWLFRARRLTGEEIGAKLDELEQRLSQSVLADWEPELASLLVGGIAESALKALDGVVYLVSLGTWATPKYTWRNSLRASAGSSGAAQELIYPPAKPGVIPKLSPIIAGLIVEGLAERVCPPHSGAQALGIQVTSLLRKQRVQNGDFVQWRKRLSIAAPNLPTGCTGEPEPKDLREWLIQRWMRAYDFTLSGPSWTVFLLAVADTPGGEFWQISEKEVLATLYSLAWRR